MSERKSVTAARQLAANIDREIAEAARFLLATTAVHDYELIRRVIVDLLGDLELQDAGVDGDPIGHS